MEKVKFEKCLDTGKKTKNGSPIIEITLTDGRSGSGFDSSLMGIKLGEDVEIEVKEAPDYQGAKRFWFMVPGQKTGSKFPAKDWTFEKRKSSLEIAVDWCKSKSNISTSDMMKCANEFFNYLNKKE